MSKNVLIAGKDLALSADFAAAFSMADFSTALASSSDDSDAKIPSGVSVIRWNRSSSLSARSVLIQAETAVGFVKNYVLYFDAPAFAARFEKFNKETCAEAVDVMFASFQHLSLEILNRIEQKKEDARIVFALRTQASVKDVILSPAARNSVQIPSNPFVAAAEASFATFAENIAATFAQQEHYSVLLVSGEDQSEPMKTDSAFGSWLASYIQALDELKSKPNLKASVNWVKAGAKTPGGFSFFK